MKVLRKVLALLLAVCSMSLLCSAAETFDFKKLPLETLEKFSDLHLKNYKDSKSFMFPAMPPKAGKIRVLYGRFASYTPKIDGCNQAMQIRINSNALGRFTASGEERILGKQPIFVFTTSQYKGMEFSHFSGDKFVLPFGPDADAVDANSVDNNGSILLLNIDDVVIGVDGNTLEISNARLPYNNTDISLLCKDMQIGYLDRSCLPAPPGSDTTYTSSPHAVTKDHLRLEIAPAGGFAVIDSRDNRTLIADTKLAMSLKAPFELTTDAAPVKEAPEFTISPWGKDGFTVKAAWKNGVTLLREIRLEADHLVHWRDTWSNKGSEIQGIPFHTRFRVVGETPVVILCGSSDELNRPSPEAHPTMLLMVQNRQKGFGITEESDYARLIGSFRTNPDGGEIYAAHFALAPQSFQVLEYSIDSLNDGGYWKFINDLRKRWNIGTVGAPYPFFFGADYKKAPGKDDAERIANAFGHLGKMAVGLQPWRRDDHTYVRSERYPKLAEGAPRAPGKTPDLDIDEFLTFKHRQASDDNLAREIKLFREKAPEVVVMSSTHPSMETVYLPLADRWPYADCAIHTANGELYHHPRYDSSHLWGYVDKDWAIGYYAPYGGSRYYDMLMQDTRKTLEIGVNGVYYDEFSFGGHRDYSRYDYGRWDGFSADLDENGKVVRLKSDVALTSGTLQHAIVEMVTKEYGKFFLGNGSACLKSINQAPIMRFTEGGGGPSRFFESHLNQVPLIFGNYGDSTTQKGTFQAVKDCIRSGCIYSPMTCNLVLKGADNFVCKLYPITIVELGPGQIAGKERFISLDSGTFKWAGVAENRAVTFYTYNANGDLQPLAKGKTGKESITIEVPKDGLVIAELVK